MKRKHDPGYKLPEVINPSENCCICIPIPNDFNHKMAFLGQLDELGYWWTWERDTLKQGREAAAVWRDIVTCIREELNMSDCGCSDNKPTNTRINPDTGAYEVSYDGGITWVPDPATDPRSSGTVFPAIPGSNGAAKKCEAANSVVGFLEGMQVDEYQQLVANASIADIITAITGALSGIGLVFAFVPAAILALLSFVVNTFAHMIAADFNAEFTASTWDTLLCVVYCAIDDDGSFTEAGWQEAKTQSLALVGGYAGQWLFDHINLIGTVGLTNAARASYPGTRVCDACDCSNGCPEKYEVFDRLAGDYGTIVAVGDNYIDVAPGATGNMTLQAIDINDCCVVVSGEMLSGTGLLTAHLPCGTDFAGGFSPTTPINECCSFIETQWTVPGVMRIYFNPCT